MTIAICVKIAVMKHGAALTTSMAIVSVNITINACGRVTYTTYAPAGAATPSSCVEGSATFTPVVRTTATASIGTGILG